MMIFILPVKVRLVYRCNDSMINVLKTLLDYRSTSQAFHCICIIHMLPKLFSIKRSKKTNMNGLLSIHAQIKQ